MIVWKLGKGKIRKLSLLLFKGGYVWEITLNIGASDQGWPAISYVDSSEKSPLKISEK